MHLTVAGNMNQMTESSYVISTANFLFSLWPQATVRKQTFEAVELGCISANKVKF